MTEAELALLGVTMREGRVFLDEHDLSGRRVVMGDLMGAGHCVPGIKAWFTGKEMEWRQLLTGGYLAADLAMIGDGLMLSALRAILKRG